MYIAMDMGTTNTRLWLCDGDAVVAAAKAPIGAGTTKKEGKAYLFSQLTQLLDRLIEENGSPEITCILASGMAGSELGLREVPHISLPADLYTLADSLVSCSIPELTDLPFLFVPGLKKCRGDARLDIMRGEETETTGIFRAIAPREACLLVLPGTHNKVIALSQEGKITDFYTTLSGELLHSVMNHTILSGTVSHDFDLDAAYVRQGAAYAEENGINAALFQIRVLSMNGLDRNALSSFLYGSILGQDTRRILRTAAGRPIYVGGSAKLQAVYCALLGQQAVAVSEKIAADATRSALSALLPLYEARNRREALCAQIDREKLIAIIRDPDPETLIPAVQALYRGGVRLVEVTFDCSGRIPREQIAALIRRIREETSMVVGAGTVTAPEEVQLAFEAGAAYIISPNFDPAIVGLTRKLGMVSMPAAYTPSEIVAAIHAGADYIKLFPADSLPKGYIKAVKAPISDAKILAVGGVTPENAAQFMEEGFCGVGIGSGLYNKKRIAAGDYAALETLAKTYTQAIKC